MSTLSTFANQAELVLAVKGKSDQDLMTEAQEADANMVLQKIFMGMMMTFDASRAAGRQATVEYDITGPGGVRHRYQVSVRDDACTIAPEGDGKADVTIKASLPTFLKVATKTANPLFLVLFGKLKVRGDRKLAQELPRWFSKRLST